jgi:hypothetical protein
MQSRPYRWLHYVLVAIAITGSLVSLFALFRLGAPRWTIPLNILSVVSIILAARTRQRTTKPDDA